MKKIKVVCGRKNFDVDVADDGDEASAGDNESCLGTLGALKEFITKNAFGEEDGDVAMRIIHRGHTIKGEDDLRLSTLGFRDGDKLLVLGKAAAPDSCWTSLIAFERQTIPNLEKSVAANEELILSLERGYLPKPVMDSVAKDTDGKLKQFNEECMQSLTKLDSFPVTASGTSPEQETRNRERRKWIVDALLKLLHQNDEFVNRLKRRIEAIENPAD